MILESDIDWKNATVQRIANLEAAMRKVADSLALPVVDELLNNPSRPQQEIPSAEFGEEDSSTPPPQGGSQDGRPWEIDIDAAGGPAALPASHIAERAQKRDTDSGQDDLISRGIVTLEQAQNLFNVYHNRLDHFVYRILGDQCSLAGVRSASPLLLAAICAVSALQTASADFEKCYQAFLQSCSSRAFSKECAVEDVQAYCIGAFWLSDMSWNLVGAGNQRS